MNQCSKFGEYNGYPTKVQFSPTENCNLDCIHCYRRDNKDSLISEDMKMEILQCEAVKVAISHVSEAWIVSGGEPLLYKHFFDIVNYLKKENVDEINSITNATVISDNIAESLVLSGITNLKISIDGAKEETVDFIRGKNTYKKIIEGIKRINYYKKIHKKKKPNLIFNFVVMRINYKELYHLVHLSKNLQIGIIEAHKCQNINSDIDKLNMDNKEDEYKCEMKRAKEYAGKMNIIIKDYDALCENYQEDKRCKEPWEFFFITQNGDVYPCCHLWGRPFGNVFNQSFQDIWYGKEFEALRLEILEKGFADMCKLSACPKMKGD